MVNDREIVPRTNTLAVVALIVAFFGGFIGSIIGFVALKEIRRTGEGGTGLAKAAIIIGFAFTAFNVIVGIIFFVSIMGQSGSTYTG